MLKRPYRHAFIQALLLLSFVDAFTLSMSNNGGPLSKGERDGLGSPSTSSFSMDTAAAAVPSFLSVETTPGGGARHQLAYHYSRGRSPGVLFCNGFQSSMQGNKAVALETYCRQRGVAFCRFDYRGHGDFSSSSSWEECSNYTLSDWVHDASTVLLETVMKDHDQVVVIGSSMGGWIACHLAIQYPQKIIGIIGLAAAPDFLEDIFLKLPQSQQDQWKRDGFLSLPTEYNPVPYRISWQLLEDARQKWNLLTKQPSGTIIPIQCRVHLVHGKLDNDIPWTKSLELMERLETDDVTLSIIKDGDHRLSRPQDLQRICGLLGEML